MASPGAAEPREQQPEQHSSRFRRREQRTLCVSAAPLVPPFIIQLRLWTCQHSGSGDDFIKRQKTFKLSPSPPPGAAFGLLITLTPRLNVLCSNNDVG